MKRIAAILLVSVMLVAARSCTFPNMTDYLASITYTEAPSEQPTEAATEAPASFTPEPTAEPTLEPTARPNDLPEGVPEDIGDHARECVLRAKTIMDEVIGYITANPIAAEGNTVEFTGRNMYRTLSGEGLVLYERLLICARDFKSYRAKCSAELMAEVKEALFTDHPELETYFDVEVEEGETGRDSGDNGNGGGSNTGRDSGKTSGGGSGGGTEETASFRTVFFLPEGRNFAPADNKEEVMAQVEALDVVSRYVVSRIPEDFSAIDKYRALAYYISLNSKYAHVENEEIPRYAMTAYGAIVNGWSICQGYTIGFEYLCRVAGLDCRRVTNGMTDDTMHFWDVVTLENGSYYVDVTWADGSVQNYYDPGFLTWFMFTADDQHVANDGTTTTGEALDRSGWR